jgi:hypothetical protein
MWWRISRGEFERRHGDGNKRAMKALDEGFVEVVRPSPRRVILWRAIDARSLR